MAGHMAKMYSCSSDRGAVLQSGIHWTVSASQAHRHESLPASFWQPYLPTALFRQSVLQLAAILHVYIQIFFCKLIWQKNSPPGKTQAEVRISVFCLLFYGSSNRYTNKQKISKMKETRRRSSPADPGQTEACCLLSLSASHLLLHNPKAASSPPR